MIFILLFLKMRLPIPMNIPLGIAITEFVSETGIPTIAHHHDFFWERERFLINCVGDYLEMAFPANLPGIQHVVINSPACRDLSYRKGVSSTIIPNVYPFESPPPPPDNYCKKIKKELGFAEDDLMILQPTRVVPRKWIERSIDVVNQLKLGNSKLVIPHASGDEGDEYVDRIQQYAAFMGVEIVSVNHIVGPARSQNAKGENVYTLGDVYQASDLVTYPSGYEGFGNAYLEALYYSKPIVVNRYKIFIADIEPLGFDVIKIDGIITRSTISVIKEVLSNQNRRKSTVKKNYDIAKKYFSYKILEEKLMHLIRTFE